MLRAQKAEGTRVVVLMLPHRQMELVFRAVKALEEEGQIQPGDVSWIMFGSGENFEYR
jgi:hypothetical protein